MIPFFEKQNGRLKVLAYGVLAGGYLSDEWLGKPPPRSKPGTASLGKYLNTIKSAGGWGHLQKVLGACKKVAKKHNVTIANVATRWSDLSIDFSTDFFRFFHRLFDRLLSGVRVIFY